jgi:aldose 1-epimerase
VAGTPFDFRRPRCIGEHIGDKDEQLQFAGGYDHNWVLDSSSAELSKAAEVFEPNSGRVLELFTTQPGVQFYTGNFLTGKLCGKDGAVYAHRGGFCLETQHFPDSPNHAQFPSVRLAPGERYRERTVFRFSVRASR